MKTYSERPIYAALGRSVIKAWASLPADVQHRLFEGAVEEGVENGASREEIAQLLHDNHSRTG